MESKIQDYYKVAIVVIVSLIAFYGAKYLVTSIFDYYNYRNQTIKSSLNTNLKQGDFDDGKQYLKNNPNDWSGLIKICNEAFKEEAIVQNMSGVYSDNQINAYCKCAMEKIAQDETFDNAIKQCVNKHL